MSDRTVRLHRVLRRPPAKVYRAFVEAAAPSKWLPPHGFTRQMQQLDARGGGSLRMAFTHSANGRSHAFGGEYLELVPHQCPRCAERFDDPGLPGLMEVTVPLGTVSCGTEPSISQAGIPEAIPLEMCDLGWQESLTQLAAVLEPGRPG